MYKAKSSGSSALRFPVCPYSDIQLSAGLLPLTQCKCRKGQDREDQKYSERNGQLRCREKFHHPSPLVEHGKYKAEQREQRPFLFYRNPGQSGIQKKNVSEKRDGSVLARGEQRRSGKASHQSEECDEY